MLRLREAAAKVANDPALRQPVNEAGSPIEYLDVPAFQLYRDADAALTTRAVRSIGKLERRTVQRTV